MSTSLARVEIRYEQDVVHARQRARLIAELLGFDRQDQTRISTAVSEIARNARQYAQGGEVEFLVESGMPPQGFGITVRDRGPGIPNLDLILEGRYTSPTGMGLGIVGSRRLLDQFRVETEPGHGTKVFLGKTLPPTAPEVTPAVLRRIAEALAAARVESPLEEIRTQNQELLRAMEELRQQAEQLVQLNRELEDTNRGVVALYARLDERSAQLAAKNEELRSFAYTVSHDLKAPLRGITGYAQELERRHKEGLGERAQFCIAQVVVASRNLDALIEDLLKYSRLDADTPTPTDVQVTDLVHSILRDRDRALTEFGVEVNTNIPPLTLHTWGRGLHQVLANLIDNAIKYSRHSKPPRVTIAATALPDAIRLTVADNGIGFDMKYHDRIFGLFNRLVRADQFEGTGAGLAIVRRLVEKLGGTVRAESIPGQGATFFVELRLNGTTDTTP